MEKKARLGRGLDALIPGEQNGGPAPPSSSSQVTIDVIDVNPMQPRKAFDDDEIRSLCETIKAHGILQPLVVRPMGERFQLIAGERRLRAARAAGLPSVPVTVVNFNDQQVLEAALIENIHRADLNPIEKAEGFKEYLTRFQITHEQLAVRLGLARSSITNLIALLDLPPEVQTAVRVGQVTTGHAKLLKGLDDRDRQVELCKEIVSRGLSVHALEALLKGAPAPEKEPSSSNGSTPAPVEKTAHVAGLEDELRQKLSTRVEIKLKAKDRGQILLTFESNDDFERLIEALRR